MELIILYIFFTGLIYVSYIWDSKDSTLDYVLNTIVGFIVGWFIIPILIGRVIKKIYKN